MQIKNIFLHTFIEKHKPNRILDHMQAIELPTNFQNDYTIYNSTTLREIASQGIKASIA